MVGTAILPIYEPPAHIDGRQSGEGIQVKGFREVYVGGACPVDLAKREKLQVVTISATMQGNDFERMLAKIGFGFAVGVFGVEAFEEVFVRPCILGEKDDVGRWVGCPKEESAWDGASMHHVNIGTAGNEVDAAVRLFATHGGPEYRVVVGRLREEQEVT